jgi:hypothetical protein
MKKRSRLFALMLSLATSFLLTVPALAVEAPMSVDEALKNVSLTYDIADSIDKTLVEKPLNLSYDGPEDVVELTVPKYSAIRKDTTFTVKHLGQKDDASVISIRVTPYAADGQGGYHYNDFYEYYLAKDGSFCPEYVNAEEVGGYVELYAGESVQFKLPDTWTESGKQTVYSIRTIIYYPQYDYSYWRYNYFLTDDAAVNKALASTSTTKPATPTTPSKTAFTDVKADAYYAAPVQWAVEKGITTGTTSTTFSPNATCTQAQIVTFLWRANGSPVADGANPFASVTKENYFYDAVVWAYSKGIIDSSFAPQAPCTRAAAVTYMYNNAGKPGVTVSGKFTDVAGTNYVNAVQWALDNGVTTGTTESTFSPDNTCTRAQIVTFLYRAMA